MLEKMFKHMFKTIKPEIAMEYFVIGVAAASLKYLIDVAYGRDIWAEDTKQRFTDSSEGNPEFYEDNTVEEVKE